MTRTAPLLQGEDEATDDRRIYLASSTSTWRAALP